MKLRQKKFLQSIFMFFDCALKIIDTKKMDNLLQQRFINEQRIIYQKVIPIELSNPKQIEENLKTVLTLEYLSIHIENTKEQIRKYIKNQKRK